MAWYKYTVFMGNAAQDKVCDIKFDTNTGKIKIPAGCLIQSENNAAVLNGEHDVAAKYWEVKLDRENYGNEGARAATVTEVAAPAANTYLRFRIKRMDGTAPIIKIVRADNGNYNWFSAIGTDDIRVQLHDDVGAAHFSMEGNYGPIFHYRAADDEYEVWVPLA